MITEKPSPLVYFGGVTERTIVGLGGSTKHVIGHTGESFPHSHSITPFLISYLEKQLGLRQSLKRDEIKRMEMIFGRTLTEQEKTNQSLHAVYLATTQMEGPQQRLEFLAKRLLHGTYPRIEKQILLATPLYVAMAE